MMQERQFVTWISAHRGRSRCALFLAIPFVLTQYILCERVLGQELRRNPGFWIGAGIGAGYEAAIRQDADDLASSVGSYVRLGSPSDRLLVGLEVSGYSTARNIDSGRAAFTAVALLFPSATSGLFLKGGAGLAGSVRLLRTASGRTVARHVNRGVGITVGVGYLPGLARKLKVTPSLDFMVQSADIGPAAASYASLLILTIGIGLY